MPKETKKSKTKRSKKAKKVALKVRVKNQPKKEIEKEEVPMSRQDGNRDPDSHVGKIVEEVKPVRKEKIKKEKKIKEKKPRKPEKKIRAKAEKTDKGKIIYEKTEKERRLIMWVGVIFFMILIAGGWIYNAKKVFKETKLEGSEESVFNFEDWEKMTSELGEKMSQMKDDLKSLQEFDEEKSLDSQNEINTERMLFSTTSEEVVATTTDEDLTSDENNEEVKNQLESLKEKLEALEKELDQE